MTPAPVRPLRRLGRALAWRGKPQAPRPGGAGIGRPEATPAVQQPPGGTRVALAHGDPRVAHWRGMEAAAYLADSGGRPA